MKLKPVSIRRKITAASFAALLATATLPLCSLWANTELDVPNGTTSLNTLTLTSSSDVTFTDITYAPTSFTLTTATLGTLDDADTTQALSITSTTAQTLTLAGGTNSDTAYGASASDLLFVANGGTLNFTGTNLTLALGASGNFDVAGTGALNFGYVVSGAFSINKTGTGTMTLGGSGTNTFGGAGNNFTLTAGTLNLNKGSGLGNASNFLILLGGTIDNTSGGLVSSTNTGGNVWDGNFTYTGTNALGLGSGGVLLGGNETVTTTANTLTVGGALIGNFSLTKAGAGTLTLTTAPVNLGGLAISAGTLNLAFGSSGSSNTYVPVISGAGGLTYTGYVNSFTTANPNISTLVLSGANTFSGPLTVANGAVQFSSINNVSGGPSNLGAPTTVANGTINLGNGLSTAQLVYTGLGTVNGATTDRVLNLANTTGYDIIYANGIGSISFTSNLTVASLLGNKTLALRGTNTLANTISGVIPDNTAASISSATTTTFISGATSISVTNASALFTAGDPISGTGLAPGTFISSISGNTITLSTATTGAGTSGETIMASGESVALSKNDTGTWFLTGANTYTGGTAIAGGVLNINSDGALGAVPSSAATNLSFSYTNTALQLAAPVTVGMTTTNTNITLNANRNISVSTSGAAAVFDTNGAGNSLTIAGIISGVGNVQKDGAGTLNLTGANTYTGSTIITGGGFSDTGSPGINTTAISSGTVTNAGASTVVVSGAGTLGASTSTATVTLDSDATLVLDNTGTNSADRVSNTSPVTFTGGAFSLLGNASATTSETVGAVTDGVGGGSISLTNNGALVALTAASYTRSTGGTMIFTGANLGTAGATGTEVLFNNAPTLTGSGTLGTYTAPVLLGAYGVDSASTNSPSFVTYVGGTGIRLLTSSEQAPSFSSAGTTTNVRLTLAGAAGSIPLGTTAIQSLQIDNTNATTTAATVINNTLGASGFTSAAGYLFSGNSPITLSGTALIPTTNGGELVLMSANSYPSTTVAGVTISSNIGQASSSNSVGTGTTGATTITVSNAANFFPGAILTGTNIATNTTITSISGNMLTLSIGTSGAVASGTSLTSTYNTGTLTAGGTGNITIGGTMYLASGGTVNYGGTGTLQLGPFATPSNTYNFNVYNGTVKLGGSATSGTEIAYIAVGATFDLNGFNFSGVPSDIGGVGSANYLTYTGNAGTITNTAAAVSQLNISYNNYQSFSGTVAGNINLYETGGSKGPTFFGNNTFTGGITLAGNAPVQFASDAAMGSLSGLVAGTKDNIVTLQNGGTGFEAYQSYVSPSSRTFGIGSATATNTSTYTLELSAGGNQTWVINGPIGATVNTTVTPNTANTAIDGVGIGNGGSGTVVLAGANTYNGPTQVVQGTLSFNSIGSTGAATQSATALGEPTTTVNGTIALGTGTNTNSVTLQYTGPTVTTDRVLNLGGAASTTTLDASGTGPITFSSAMTVNSTGNRTLSLIGTNLGANTLSGGLANPSGFTSTLTKQGVGMWVLGGANGFTGTTTISNGTLVAGATGALSATSAITVSGNGTLLLSNSTAGDRVNNSAAISLGGTIGRLSTTSTSNITEGTGAHVTGGVVSGSPTTSTLGLGALTLTTNSNLDFGTGGVATLVFTSFTSGNHLLNILNYTSSVNFASAPTTSGTDGTDDRLIFNADQSANLGFFSFSGTPAKEIALDSGFYEIVPASVTAVPEPTTWLAGALCAVAGFWSQRRRLRGAFSGAVN